MLPIPQGPLLASYSYSNPRPLCPQITWHTTGVPCSCCGQLVGPPLISETPSPPSAPVCPTDRRFLGPFPPFPLLCPLPALPCAARVSRPQTGSRRGGAFVPSRPRPLAETLALSLKNAFASFHNNVSLWEKLEKTEKHTQNGKIICR